MCCCLCDRILDGSPTGSITFSLCLRLVRSNEGRTCIKVRRDDPRIKMGASARQAIGLTSHPQHHVAQRQMHKGYGGVLSVEFHSEAIAMAVAGALQTPGWGVRKPCWSIGPALHLSVESQV